MHSLQRHQPPEVYKQVYLQMQKNGLQAVKVLVTRQAGRIKIHFEGPSDQVKKAEEILAKWP